ncbi:MAG: hypothetical protein RBT63_00465 [Bdellovibrionales bacterium]|nr:hypothetical protein [Bdellovibrionales bacterium]
MAEVSQSFKEQGVDAYPLCWPVGWMRTQYKKRSQFSTAFARARDGVFHELKLMGVSEGSEPSMVNRQCQICGGYELNDGTSELCYCDVDENDDEIVECSNGCGETVRLGGFCSTSCKTEWEIENEGRYRDE